MGASYYCGTLFSEDGEIFTCLHKILHCIPGLSIEKYADICYINNIGI